MHTLFSQIGDGSGGGLALSPSSKSCNYSNLRSPTRRLLMDCCNLQGEGHMTDSRQTGLSWGTLESLYRFDLYFVHIWMFKGFLPLGFTMCFLVLIYIIVIHL